MNQEKTSRRNFMKTTAAAAGYFSLRGNAWTYNNKSRNDDLLLGGPVQRPDDPEAWISSLKELGYRAAYCPLPIGAPGEEIRAYREAAKRENIIIAEVGAWSNLISPNETERKEAIEKCINGLQLADEIGARCCVDYSGSRSKDLPAGPHEDNLAQETFDLVVETTRKIVDTVKPVTSFFTLEAMPWSFPHSPDAYLQLLKAIDRKGFAVHLDPVNMVTSPEIYFRNGDMIRECFKKLGPHIKSCHAKDIILREDIYTPHLSEVRPGLGKLNYPVFLRELQKLKDIPLMMEHLKTQEEYKEAADYIRSIQY